MAVNGRGARDKSQLIHKTDPRGGWGARVTSGAGKRKMLHFVTRMSGPRLVCSATPQVLNTENIILTSPFLVGPGLLVWMINLVDRFRFDF